jgi:hypothetical protein
VKHRRFQPYSMIPIQSCWIDDELEDLKDTYFLTISSGSHMSWWKPSHDLWYELLQRSIERYLSLLDIQVHNARQKKELIELTEWIFGGENVWIGSFIVICDNCKIDAEKVQKKIRSYLELRVEGEEGHVE